MKGIFELNTLTLISLLSDRYEDNYRLSRFSYICQYLRKTRNIKRRVAGKILKIEKNGFQILVQRENLHK